MRATGVRVLEDVSLVTPFGVRFVDVVRRSAVASGLAARVDLGGRRWPLVPTRGGTYVLHQLPSDIDSDEEPGTDAWWAAIEDQRVDGRLVIADPAGRYVGCRLPVRVPLERSFAMSADQAGPVGELAGGVPLFPSRGYPFDGRGAVVRELRLTAGGPPASAAVLSLSLTDGGLPLGPGGGAAVGVADRDGHVAVGFPWPELPNGVTAFADTTWWLIVRASATPAGAIDGDGPDLVAALAQSQHALFRPDGAVLGVVPLTPGLDLDLGTLHLVAT